MASSNDEYIGQNKQRIFVKAQNCFMTRVDYLIGLFLE